MKKGHFRQQLFVSQSRSGGLIDTGSFLKTIAYNNTEFNIIAIRGDGGQQTAAVENVPSSSWSREAVTASYIEGSNVDGAVSNATNAENAKKVYVDYGDTSTTAQLIPTYTADGGADGYKDLKVSNNPLSYYYRTTNDITGISNQADELHIGGGANYGS